MHAQPPGDFGLRAAFLEECGRLQATLFQVEELGGIALHTFGVTHARSLTRRRDRVNYIMRKSVEAISQIVEFRTCTFVVDV